MMLDRSTIKTQPTDEGRPVAIFRRGSFEVKPLLWYTVKRLNVAVLVRTQLTA